jgi:iron complex outermembrane receptor protein
MTKICYLLFFLLPGFFASAQKLKVAGKVTNEKGDPVTGASVHETGTNNRTVTDGNGVYLFYVRYAQATLQVRCAGYGTVEREINGKGTQHFTLKSEAVLSQMPLPGSRNKKRSAADIPSPADIIPMQDVLASQGPTDLNQLLQLAVPSFNSNRQIGADGVYHMDPASLRGLGPDQMLVLINGKRRHQSSLVNLSGSRGRGNTGTDLNAIPAAAIERIEILRDGAAAQYGSDAIAGVINIVLKQQVNELTANVNAGMFQAKYRLDNEKFDGLNYGANVNYGLAMGKKGFVNLTADYNFRDHTNRANTVPETEMLRREYGDPKIHNAALFYNAEVPVGNNIRIYSFGGLNRREGDAYAWTRTKDSKRNVRSLYPNGFDPVVAGRTDDHAATVGIRGLWGKWEVDLSNTYGFNRFGFHVNNSLNASLQTVSPTSFDAGGSRLIQHVSTVNVTRFYNGILNGLHVAFGGEHRLERYRISEGEMASWYLFDSRFEGGAQGFQGFGPGNVVSAGRSNVSGYIDLEASLTKKLLVNAAGRFEHYSDFGNTINWKAGLSYKLSDHYAIRGSVSTGFRAPSLAQKYYNTTTMYVVNGQSVEALIAGNNSLLAKSLGVPELSQEVSENAGIGITAKNLAGFSVTVDGYYIKVKDRIVLTGKFNDKDPQIGSVLRSLRVSEAQFFANALASTTTYGLDAVVKHAASLGKGQLNTALAANFNYMELGDINTSPKLAGKENIYFNKRERRFILAAAPPSKINLTFDYTIDKLGFMLRFVRFGEITLANKRYGQIKDVKTGELFTESEYTDVYKPKVQTDLSVHYSFNKNIFVSVGGSNILNVYPDLLSPDVTESGGGWDPVQMGSNGAFFFTRVGFKF